MFLCVHAKLSITIVMFQSEWDNTLRFEHDNTRDQNMYYQ